MLVLTGCTRAPVDAGTAPGGQGSPTRAAAQTHTPASATTQGAAPATEVTAASHQAPVSTSPAQESSTMQTQLATFGAGCFWGVEATFRLQPGVVDAAVGYSGGHLENPTYKQVCTDTTGHAEVVQLTFDPTKVSYEQLVNLFFRLHDPTQLNRQGPDYGTQYRSVIFYHSPEQKQVAEAVKARRSASGKHKRPIVTVVEPAQTFYRAEEYHQQYYVKNGLENTCHLPQPD
ncbi:MAG: peptide methionine sulfoxide reductase MsrA [Phycisphaerae bacterium]